jgi:hypothetical protein
VTAQPTYYKEEPYGDFNTVFYWKSPDKRIHCVHIERAVDLEHAKKLAMMYLHDTMEVFLNPILAVVKGGKA